MNDLISAISDHSHYEDDGDKFWETMWDNYGAEYLAISVRPSLSDFQVYCEDRDLVPDDEVFSNEER